MVRQNADPLDPPHDPLHPLYPPDPLITLETLPTLLTPNAVPLPPVKTTREAVQDMSVLTDLAFVGRQRALELNSTFVDFNDKDFASNLRRLGTRGAVCSGVAVLDADRRRRPSVFRSPPHLPYAVLPHSARHAMTTTTRTTSSPWPNTPSSTGRMSVSLQKPSCRASPALKSCERARWCPRPCPSSACSPLLRPAWLPPYPLASPQPPPPPCPFSSQGTVHSACPL